MGFYRHDQWGMLAFLDVTWVYRSSSSSGVITVSEALLPEAIINKGGATSEVNAQAHDIVVHDVNATGLWKIQLN